MQGAVLCLYQRQPVQQNRSSCGKIDPITDG